MGWMLWMVGGVVVFVGLPILIGKAIALGSRAPLPSALSGEMHWGEKAERLNAIQEGLPAPRRLYEGHRGETLH